MRLIALVALLLAALCVFAAMMTETGLRMTEDIRHRLFVQREPAIPDDVIRMRDIAYGSHARHVMDVYHANRHTTGRPVGILVHGGAWGGGDKNNNVPTAVNFARRDWLFVLIRHRMTPEVTPLQQAEDIAQAISYVQHNAHTWGGDGDKVVLMGHSSGGHLAALVAARPELVTAKGGQMWRATIGIDSSLYDIPDRMRDGGYTQWLEPHFGTDPALWYETSPVHQARGKKITPLLAICSRLINNCNKPFSMQASAQADGNVFEIMPVDLGHSETADMLGASNPYTIAVLSFLEKHAGMPLQ